MKIEYNEIRIKKRVLLEKGILEIGDTGCYVMRGYNGCGKTLWLRRFHLSLEGKSVYVSQDNNAIIYGEDVLHNISMCKDNSENDIICKELREYGFDFLLDLKLNKMSGGEKRLVSLLRGIYSTSNVVLLDEPLNDLDYVYVNKIVNLIRNLKKSKLFLVITHDDRFDSIADGYLDYKDKKINVLVKKIIQEEDSKKTIKKREINIFRKTKLKNCPSILLLICMAIIFLSTFASSLATKDDTERVILGKRQVNMYVPASSIGANIGIYGAVPLNILKEVLAADTSEAIALFNKMDIKYNRELRTNLSLMMNSKNVEIYPLEYYDYEKCQYYYPLDTYIMDKGFDTSNDAVKTMPKFSNWTHDSGNNIIEFNENEYKEIIKEIDKEKNFEAVFVTIVLDDNTKLEEFLQLEEIKNLENKKDVYIQTNETIDFYSQTLIAIENRDFLEKVVIICILVALVDIGIWILRLRVKRKIYILFANMGVVKKILEKKSYKKYSFLILLVIWSVIVLTAEVFLLNKYNLERSIMIYLPCLSMIIVFLLATYIKNRLFVREINRAYKWNKR